MKKLKTFVAKEEIPHFEQFLFLSQCFQKSSAADLSKCVYRWKRVSTVWNVWWLYLFYSLQLRKAYFRQVEEISALKEQLALKDKRINQLEDEVTILRKGGSSTSTKQGESDC